MVLKTGVQVTTGFFRGKAFIHENLNTWSFPETVRRTALISMIFFWRSVKRQSMTAEEVLEEKVKIEINFDSLCHKFLAWMFFAFYVSRGTFEEEIVSINSFSPTFFRAGNFSDFWGSFFGKAARQAIYVTGDIFSWIGFLRELFVYIIIFKNWGEGFWILSNFLAALLKLHSLCPEEPSAEQFSFQKKSTLFSDFDPQKIDSEKQLGVSVKTVPK